MKQGAFVHRAGHVPIGDFKVGLRLVSAAVVLLALLTVAPTSRAQTEGLPEITSQGFKIEDAQQGLLGRFAKLRVRMEAPEGIEALTIKERSYEVDLAVTPERSHYDLFSIEKRVRLHKDVTLNFQSYINRKLDAAGSYRFLIRVTDGEGRTASATLKVEVREEAPQAQAAEPEPEPDPVRQGSFDFRRVGAGSVAGAADFGLTWKTLDDAKIVIEITGIEDGSAKLSELEASDYDRITTREALAEVASKAAPVERLTVPTAQNLAAGRSFAVVRQDDTLVFKVKESATSLSELGTTVTLTGEYKN